MLWVVTYRFEDNNGRTAETMLRLPEGLDLAGAVARAQALGDALAACSNAVLSQFDLSQDFPGPAGSVALPGSSVERTGVLFYRNVERYSSFRVPAVSEVLFEESGPFEDIRITRARAQAVALLDNLEQMLEGALDKVELPYGQLFVVGGRDKL